MNSYFYVANKKVIDIRSEGCDDLGKGPGCGKSSIWVNGKDYSLHRRGINVVVLDYRTGMNQLFNHSTLNLDARYIQHHHHHHRHHHHHQNAASS